MAPSTEWQLTREAAERYEDILVREILGPFARSLVDWAAIRPGEWVLDIGCGTGAATRYAARKIGAYGRVVGMDSSPVMLEVARSLALQEDSSPAGPSQTAIRPIEWQEGTVYKMALPSKVFDIVLSAQTFQFLSDLQTALKEIRRVLRPGGRLALSVWAPISDSPYFAALVKAIAQHIDKGTAITLGEFFTLTDGNKIVEDIKNSGFRNILRTMNRQDLYFPSLDEFIPRHISATSISPDYAAAGPQARQAVVDQVKAELAPLLAAGGGFLAFQSHFVRAFT